MDNVLALHRELKEGTYKHGEYQHFRISDPKPRDIHKALVRDRLLHHALYCKLYPFFDRTFIADSYSCRKRKGTHKAMDRFRSFASKVSRNHTRTCWVLKCDIRKFFASIDQDILMESISSYIPGEKVINLVANIVSSFSSPVQHSQGSTLRKQGLPLGNLTSQLLVNVYMNEFDQFVKHTLKAKHYIRYADDFVILSISRRRLDALVPRIADFLGSHLKLSLHPDKVSIQALASGVDFLGWVHFPDHRVLRTSTKRRMFKRIGQTDGKKETVQSYLGLIGHGNTQKLRRKIEDEIGDV